MYAQIPMQMPKINTNIIFFRVHCTGHAGILIHFSLTFTRFPNVLTIGIWIGFMS